MLLRRTDRRARRGRQPNHFQPHLESLESRLALSGTGLMAEYFTNINLTGTPALVRTDAQANFNWSTGSPGTGIASDNFGVHWEGQVKATTAGTYNFRTISDDGVKLWINGNLVINHWNDHAQATDTTSTGIILAAGQKATIVLEYYEHTGSAVMQLQWSSGGAYAAIPQSNLYTVDDEFADLSGVAGSGWNVLNNTNYPGIDPTGMTDSTAAFRKAWDTLITSGTYANTLYIPAGTYKITDSIGRDDTNGNFEFSAVATSSTTAPTGWTWGGAGGTVWNNSAGVGKAWLGNQFVSLNNNGLGSLSQTFTTLPNVTYNIDFSLSGMQSTTPYQVNVSATGGSTNPFSFTYDNTKSPTQQQIIRNTYTFTTGPTQTSATVTFASTALSSNGANYGPTLDDVLIGTGAKYGLNIVGEDPSKVIIKWAGTAGGTMLYMRGADQSAFSRITWDGGATTPGTGAGVIVHNDCSNLLGSGTNTQHTDEVFKNCGTAIEGGLNNVTYGKDSENMIKRCTFTNCTQAGVSVRDSNSVNFYTWNCTFNQCNYGLTNLYGAGQFQVYQCTFNQSTGADVAIANAGYFSLRENYSTGSRRFFEQGNIPTPTMVTLQGNTILDTTLSAISLGSFGPLTLIDNVFRGASGFTGPLVEMTPSATQSSVIAIGNTFGVSNPSGYNPVSNLNGTTRMVSPNNVVNRTTVNPAAPDLPTTAPNMRRSIWEVPAGANAATIQGDITSASINSSSGRTVTAGYLANVKPIVYFPAACYIITSTLTVPAKSDMQLLGVGDNWNDSQLVWLGPAGGTMMRVAGPSHVTLSGLQLKAGPDGGGSFAAETLVFDNADQAGGRFFGDQVFVAGDNVGLYTERLDQTVTELRAFYHLTNASYGLKVVGGPLAQAGTPGTGKVNVYGNSGGFENYAVGLSAGGKLLLAESWLEGNNHFASLTDKGTLTVQTGIIAKDPTQNTIDINNWNGKATVLNLEIFGPDSVSGANPNTNTLFMGNMFTQNASSNDYYTNTATAGTQGALRNSSRQYLAVPGTWTEGVITDSYRSSGTDFIAVPDAFITSMLAQTRAEHPSKWQPISFSTTDVHMNRVTLGGATSDGLRITRYIAPTTSTATSEAPPRLAQYIASGSGLVGGLQSTSPNGTMYQSGWNDLTPTITINLGGTYNLTGFRVWNWNETVSLNKGIQTVEILTSSDGVNYTSRGNFTFAQAPGTETYEGQEFSLGTTWNNVQSVRLRVISNYGSATNVGLAKIQFVGSPV